MDIDIDTDIDTDIDIDIDIGIDIDIDIDIDNPVCCKTVFIILNVFANKVKWTPLSSTPQLEPIEILRLMDHRPLAYVLATYLQFTLKWLC